MQERHEVVHPGHGRPQAAGGGLGVVETEHLTVSNYSTPEQEGVVAKQERCLPGGAGSSITSVEAQAMAFVPTDLTRYRSGYPSEGEVLDCLSEPGPPTVIEALRDATRSRHESLASSPGMSRLFECDYTIAEYRAHLERLLGFFEPLENAASHRANAEGSPSVVRRSTDLREDLRIMGASAHDIDAIDRCQRLPSFAPGGLRGYTYVVLGSTLGAKIIVEQLRTVLGPTASFRFYGDENGLYQAAWSAFRSDLEGSGKNDVEPICATAVEIFDAYAAWFSEPLPGPEAADDCR
jgi:heme oxygenase